MLPNVAKNNTAAGISIGILYIPYIERARISYRLAGGHAHVDHHQLFENIVYTRSNAS